MEQIKSMALWIILLILPAEALSQLFGCMDPNSCNYNANATTSDGQCNEFESIGTVDSVVLYPSPILLTSPVGYQFVDWLDGYQDASRATDTAGIFMARAKTPNNAPQASEALMINETPQTQYQGSWANAFKTNGELLRESPTNQWSFTCWVKLEEGDTHHSIIGKDLWWGNGYKIWIYNGELKSAFNSAESGYVVRTAGQVDSGDYHHLAVVHDGNVRTHYVDGVAIDSWNEPSTFEFDDHYVGIGFCASGFDCTFNGNMDELMVWHTPLSIDQVQEVMYCPYEIDQSGLVGFWDFETNNGGILADKSGNGHNLTQINSPSTQATSRVVRCFDTCVSLSYNISVSLPTCWDVQACNFSSQTGYSYPDSCQYLEWSSITVRSSESNKTLGEILPVLEGGEPPYTLSIYGSCNNEIPNNEWSSFLPGRYLISGTDHLGCQTKGQRSVLIPMKN